MYARSSQASSTATLDGLPFGTFGRQRQLTTNNSIIFEEYENRDTGALEKCYGRIQSIIEHEMYPDCPVTLRHVLIECDWYSPTGVSTPNGLLQVSLDLEMSRSNRWTFLKNMHRSNVVLWPSYSHSPVFVQIPNTFFVITHTAPVLERPEDDHHVDADDDNHEEKSD